ncbi:major facilitator superfamily protein [Stylonychia lemnae]|uniref:Lysosomal dipeptide transporter MFSD1 n=1 Tax=Stylonychia lemnae TaxID=5949 RepID=A0A077ZUJ8_STYLE|nr:major facilitator superfamily protein [Stylonychia lemnae]|eukprot:CDW72975.1 major facilitator superfamily protein [Stylonychia lemnae]
MIEQQTSQPKMLLYKETRMKYLFLFCTCFCVVGIYFCYDNPGSIETALEDDLNLTQTQYSLLYTVYSYPNMILPVFGGVLIDILGVRPIYFHGWWQEELYLGNLKALNLNRLGSECMSVAQSTTVSKWFSGSLLSFVFGLNIAIGNISSTLNGQIIPRLYYENHYDQLGLAFLIGSIICTLSFLANVVICIFDKADDNRALKIKALEDLKKTQEQLDEDKKEEENKEKCIISWANVKELSYALWLVVFLIFLLYGAYLPFQQNAAKIMQDKFKVPESIATQVYSIPNIIAALSCPFMGMLGDRFNIRVYLNTVSYIELLPILIAGTAYSVFAGTIWSIIPSVAKEKQLGTAYGLGCTFLNIGLSLIPTLGSYLHDQTQNDESHGFFWQSFLWLILSGSALILGVMLQIENKRNYGGRLNNANKQEDNQASDKAQQKLDQDQNVEIIVEQVDENALLLGQSQNLNDAKIIESNDQAQNTC